MEDKKKFIPVGTKVSPEARQRLIAIEEKKGFSEYDLLQMFCDVAIRRMDDRHNLSYDMETLIQLMDGMKNWKTSIRLTDAISDMKIEEAFYVLAEKGRTGCRLAHVQGNPQDMFRTETFNIQSIVERFVCLAMPNVYKRLRMLGNDIGTDSVYETLMRIVDDYATNPDADELRIMFADNDWENGHSMRDLRKTKRTRNDHPELFK